MDRNQTLYRVVLLEQRGGSWVPMPGDCEYVETLDEAREHGAFASIAIYAPGQRIGIDAPLETIIEAD